MPRKLNLAKLLLVPAPAESEVAFPAQIAEAPNRKTRAKRLSPLPGPYVRVPLQWLTKPGRAQVFLPEIRLFLFLLYRSHWGS